MRAPFGEWLPDRPTLDNPGATVATNVYPRSSNSYGPFNNLSVTTDALDARCQGAFASRAADGVVTQFAGDASKLYSLNTTTWSDVSVGGGYSTALDETWEFVQYGQRVIATNYADAIQSWVLGSSSAFAVLDSSAPKARHIAAVSPAFVMAGNTDDSVDGMVPNRVWWCARDDPTDWPTIGTADAEEKESDYNDLPTGGWVQAVIGAVGGAAGAILCDTAVYRIEYAGPPTVFDFPRIEGARGTPAPNSVINVGPFAFYLGEDGFYVFDGAQSLPIGNQKVDKTFYSDLNQSYFHRVYAAADPINKLVFWAYPGDGHVGGNPDKVMIYNWELGRWARAEVNCQLIYRALSSGYTLEQLDSFGDLDSLPFSLDSRVWTGGRIVLSGFDADNKQGYFTGSALAATLETTEFASQNGRRLFLRGVRPLVDGGTITTALRHRDTPQAALTTNTATSAGSDGVCPQRQSARYVRARVNIAAGGSWGHALGIEPDMIEEGLR